MSPQIRQQKIINKIARGEYTEKELIGLKTNATRLDCSDIVKAVEHQMRKQFPKAATKVFGAEGDDAKARLEETYNELAAKFDLSKNKIGKGVKTGGERIKGNAYIDWYISYRNDDGYGAFLGLMQEAVDTELKVRVRYSKIGKGKFEEEQFFGMHDYAQAVELYKAHLAKVIV